MQIGSGWRSFHTTLPNLDETKAFIRFVLKMPDVTRCWVDGTDVRFQYVIAVTFGLAIETVEDACNRLDVYKTLFMNLRASTYDALKELRVPESETQQENT